MNFTLELLASLILAGCPLQSSIVLSTKFAGPGKQGPGPGSKASTQKGEHSDSQCDQFRAICLCMMATLPADALQPQCSNNLLNFRTGAAKLNFGQ